MAHWTEEVQRFALSSTAAPDHIIDLQLGELAAGAGGVKPPSHCDTRSPLCLRFWCSVNPSRAGKLAVIWDILWWDEHMQAWRALACHDEFLWICHYSHRVEDTAVISLLRERERGREGEPEYSHRLWERGTPNPKNPGLFLLISEKRHHNPAEGVQEHLPHGDKRGARGGTSESERTGKRWRRENERPG